jgi:hypothetical protein
MCWLREPNRPDNPKTARWRDSRSVCHIAAASRRSRFPRRPLDRHAADVTQGRYRRRDAGTGPAVSISQLAAIRQVLADAPRALGARDGFRVGTNGRDPAGAAPASRRSPVSRSRALWPVAPASRRSRWPRSGRSWSRGCHSRPRVPPFAWVAFTGVVASGPGVATWAT